MERPILLVIALAFIATIVLGCAWLWRSMVEFSTTPLNSAPGYNPAYVDRDGDCFVPAQGDPLYDEHYAKNVNNPNCQAIESREQAGLTEAQAQEVQAQAEAIQAETDRVKAETKLTNIGAGATVLILIVVGIIFLVGLLK